MSKKNRKGKSSSGSSESFESAHSSITVVPSTGSVRSSNTVKADSADTFYSTSKNNVNTTVPVHNHGAKSDTVKLVGKANKYHSLKKAKSVGNIPTDKGNIVVATEKKKPVHVVATEEPVNRVPKCTPLSPGTSIESDDKYHSDHNPVAVFIPGLFDGNKSAYVITYNEKGNTPNYNTLYNSFFATLQNLLHVDMIFIGIQEGDVYKTFIKTILNCIEDKKHVNSELPTTPLFKSVDNITIGDKVLNIPESKLSNWKLTTNTYKSTGKECLKKWKGVCLVNGCYVLLKTGCGLTVEDSGKDIIMKGGILNTTKHCAWAVVKQESSKIKHVFASCHLEYSGKYNPEKKDLLGYDKRAEQLTGYINMLYKKYGDSSRFIFCGDTNMRMLTSANYALPESNTKKGYILDQMLYYLMQCDKGNVGIPGLKSVKAIHKYATLDDISRQNIEYINGNKSKPGISRDDYWDCKGCDISMGRKMLLYRLGGRDTFCSCLKGEKNNKGNPKCSDDTLDKLGDYVTNKFIDAVHYSKSNATRDKYAGYCMNPEFVVGDNKFRAYDFSYKDLTSKCMMNTIWDVYNYKPTAIFTLDGPKRTFDYDKRVKSGNILAPAVVDRVFMFEPHKQYVSIDNTKVGFVKY